MKLLIQYFVSTIILFPIILFVLTYVICRKKKVSNSKSFGFAADVTTIILFFSVPLSISSLWNHNGLFNTIFICIVLLIAIFFTYKDWRTKKELEVFPLLKKVWRLYFILLTLCYIVIWIVGLIQSIMEYVVNN